MDFGQIASIIGAGAGAIGIANAYDRLGDIGASGAEAAGGLAADLSNRSQFKPFTVTTATGGQFSAGDGAFSNTLGSQEQALQNQLLTQAGTMGNTGATDMYNQGMNFLGNLGGSPAEREGAIYDRIRAMQMPEENRQRLALEERMYNQGRGGVRTSMFGGTPEQLAMEKAQAEARNTAAYQAMQQSMAEQQQNATLGSSFLGQSQALQQQDLQRRLGALQGAYTPQAAYLQALQPGMTAAGMAQQQQQFGTGLFGETMMSGIETGLAAGLGQANLIGSASSGLLSGATQGLFKL